MENDSDLARAIANSLQESDSSINQQEDHSEDDQFQADLNRAIEMSKAESKSVTKPAPTSIETVPAQPPQSSFLSERALLEKQRLERQKRLRGIVDDEQDNDDEPAAKRQQLSSSISKRLDKVVSNSETPSPRNEASSSSPAEQLFWNGELRQTGNMYADPKKNTKPCFHLTDIIGDTSTISFALVSSYCTDWEFAFKRFAVGQEMSVPVILVNHPIGDRKPGIKAYQDQNWIRTQPYLHTPFSSMHMKFMLIFYKSGRLRIMITTANLVDYDWKSIENTAWVQDVPLRDKAIAHDRKATDFPAIFQNVLKAANVKPALDCFLRGDHPNLPLKAIEDLRCKWDFSKVKVHLVPSLSGSYEGWPNVIQHGHPRLMKAIIDIGARAEPSKNLHLECQGSSLGKVSKKWLKEFYHSARGADAQSWLKVRGKDRTDKLPWPGSLMKILFPTKETVQNSTLGEAGGGTMFFKRSDWNSSDYPKELFHDSKSRRGKILMHSKMILGTLKPVSKDRGISFDGDTETDSDIEIIGEKKPTGWVYMGSHNFTMAAWGSFNAKSTPFTPVFSVANYELGIVIPLYNEREANDIACWERPPTSYATNNCEPWIQSESKHFKQG